MNTITLSQLKAMPQSERLNAFVDWLATQPRDEVYNFGSNEDCALCRWSKRAMGHETSANGTGIREDGPYMGESIPIYKSGSDVMVAMVMSNTFGQLYDRLSAIISKSFPTPVEMTDEAMELLESRPLVPFGKERVS